MWNKSPADQFFSSVMKKNIFAVISSVSICLVFRSLITINNNNHFSRGNSFILTLKLESVATYTWRYLLLITCPKQSSGVPLILTSSAFHILTSFFSLALFSDSLSYPRSLTPPPPPPPLLCSFLSDPQLCQDFSSPPQCPSPSTVDIKLQWKDSVFKAYPSLLFKHCATPGKKKAQKQERACNWIKLKKGSKPPLSALM